jgi:tetratricopeptide (TPR) repeat protein
VRNIAKINKVIYFLIVENNETILENSIADIQEAFNEFHYISKAYLRFEVLKDFIWLFTGDFLMREKLQEKEKQNEEENNPKFEKSLENITDAKLRNDLKGSLDYILFTENLAQSLKYKFLPIRRITLWAEIKEKYEDARNLFNSNNTIDGKNKAAILSQINLGYARACLNMGKYSKLIEFIKSNKSNVNLYKNSEFWILGAQAHRKILNYDKADKFIEHALNLTPTSLKASQESDLIKKFKICNAENYVKTRKTTTTLKEQIPLANDTCSDDYYAKMHDSKKVNYNILSIDGGGLRGIIPAVWLSEIEMRTRRPISHMFNMIAGTSTGAIIGSALSLPDSRKETGVGFGSTKPKFSATDILEMYVDKGARVFSNKKGNISSFFSAKYSSEYISNLMENFSFK